jgi:hypothetical protein
VLALGVGALVSAVVIERRSADPVIDLRLFHNRVFVSAIASLMLAMIALFAVSFLLPFISRSCEVFRRRVPAGR